ncbi:MAG: hypothetical protein ACRC5A_15225 [Enterobacteriaceae bacterium]
MLLNFVLVIPLRCDNGGGKRLLWLARECLSAQQWRTLRQQMIQWRAR